MSSWFDLAVVCLLACISFPFALIGVVSSDRGQRLPESQSLLVSACTSLCAAGAWFALLMY